MDKLIKELRKFSQEILDLGNSIPDNRIEVFEKKNQLNLPSDFKYLISQYNGINLMGSKVYGFDLDNVNSIENVYYFEHFEVVEPQWKHLVPFSPDGGGNFYCHDTSRISKKGTCPIIFWVSNYVYSSIDHPETVNTSFTQWFKQVMIDWTLEDYNYDGSEKKHSRL